MLKLKRTISGYLLLGIVLLTNVSLLVSPNVANAQLITANPDLIAQAISLQLTDQVKSISKSALVQAISTGLINLMLYEVNTMAANAAVWVASGGNAEKPLFDARTANQVFQQTSAQFAAGIVDEFGGLKAVDGVLQKYNVSIRDNPYLKAAISQGIQDAFISKASTFDYQSIKDNWQSYLATTLVSDATPEEKTAIILSAVAAGFDPGANEFSAATKIYTQTLSDAQAIAQRATTDHEAADGFVDKTNPVTGGVETPADFIKKQFQDSLEKAQVAPFQITESMLQNTDVLGQIGLMAGSVFANTLTSELLNRLYSGVFKDLAADVTKINPFEPGQIVKRGRAEALARNKSLLAFKPLQVTDFNLLSEFTSCPTTFRGLNRQINNCVMDTSFAAAVARAGSGDPLTLADAIEQGYIDGGWPLIPSSDQARDQDSKCYTFGFCHGNLLKLRKARIIPLGWEIAAESAANSAQSPVTLSEVMGGFNSCNTDGELDAEHPWCHLVDPNWVLRYPLMQCRTLGYGQLLTSSGTDARAEECVDVQTCIAEDENGNCTGGWGYCVREKNTWDFRGDSCPAQFASCLSFTTADKEVVNYLSSTIDYGSCDENSAGCTWYATAKRPTSTGYAYPSVNNSAVAEASDTAYSYRAYFNAKAEECDSEDGGCSELFVRTADTHLNLVPNPSFETDSGADGMPDGWYSKSSDAIIYDRTNAKGRSGSAAVKVSASAIYQSGLVLGQHRSAAFSFWAAQPTVGAANVQRAVVRLDDTDLAERIDLANLSVKGDCRAIDFTGDGILDAIEINATPATTTYERFECVFTTPGLQNDASFLVAEPLFFPADVWIDDVQLEQGSDASIFRTGYGAAQPVAITAKIAPSYLGCDGAADDPAECANYAMMCTELDAGCTSYDPLNGDPAITGIVSENDYCPASCVGYDTYKQEGTTYEPNGAFPLYFIPDTAKSCRADVVGCDEFTNLATESAEYYTYLRSCVTPNQAAGNTSGDNEATFYTWEGSDTNGFQLKSWNMLESNLDGAGYQSYAHASGFVEANPGAAPCTHFTTTVNGISCADDQNIDSRIDNSNTACDEHADILVNNDCREFYDALGNIHYRLWPQTITVNASCSGYRKTSIAGLGLDGNGDSVDDGQQNCQASGGYFDSNTSECRYYGFADESEGCSASDNGCRLYTGGSSNNSRAAFTDLFESGSILGWSEFFNPGSTSISNESLAFGGHSLTSRSVISHLVTVIPGKTYTLSFWAKGSGVLEPGFDFEASGMPGDDAPFATSAGITLTNEWKQYDLGPLNMDSARYPTFGAGTALIFIPGNNGTYFLDNITLREGEANLTLIKDSWVTPAVCDADRLGNPSDQYYLGCSQYQSPAGAVTLKSFSRLCGSDKVGCTGYFLTQQSTSPFAEMKNGLCHNIDSNADGQPDVAAAPSPCYTFNTSPAAFNTLTPVLCSIVAGSSSCYFDLDSLLPAWLVNSNPRLSHVDIAADTMIVPADRDIYAIIGADDKCSSDAVGCTEVGKPQLSSDRTSVESYTTTYLLNDPENYANTLCSTGDLYCSAFDAGAKGTYFFKDPLAGTCEYKTDVQISGSKYDGWFRTGTSEFCYGTGTCSNSAASCSANSDCRLGTCSGSGAVCSGDAECSIGQTCDVADPSATCRITSGAYVVGGNVSGIWKNGDVAYNGLVGQCSAEWNGCSEFQDTLDVDEGTRYGANSGKSYFFVDNENLDENSLLTSQACNGKASQRLGCTMFRDTGSPALTSNSSATYMASVHADDLFGDEKFALVTPVDCSGGNSVITKPDGTTVDLCANRCVYDKSKFDPADSRSWLAKLGIEALTGDPALYSRDDIYVFGTACVSNDDCSPLTGDTGDPAKGLCLGTVRESPAVTVAVPRLVNDVNRVLKVNRSRECSQWLTCSSSQTVWDEATSSYKTVCDAVDLCTKYSALGDSSFCSSWNSDNPAVLLDANRYASRDITWYGEDYSGMAIPDLYPVEELSQVNIAPEKRCAATGVVCDTSSDCGTTDTCDDVNENDFRLALDAGSCVGTATGGDCSVGYCSASGEACADDTACGTTGGNCTTGVCYAVSATACTDDTQCSGTQTCLGGFCTTDTGFCTLDNACATGSSCFRSVNAKTGSCYRDRCIVAPNGNKFDVESAEGQVCRAYPEQNSPFPNDVVKQWSLPEFKADGTLSNVNFTEDIGDRAASLRLLAAKTISGFDAAKLCTPGEDCECNYKKLSTSAGASKYVSQNVRTSELAQTIDPIDSSVLGMCSGGDADSSLCTKDADCGNVETGARCFPITREDTILGLDGYCLERDSSINILGNATQGACLTWLPVDQLSGSSDLFGKYTGAGYFQDTWACSYTDMFAKLAPSNVGNADTTSWRTGDNPVTDVACAETGSFTDLTWNDSSNNGTFNSTVINTCVTNAKCPSGYWTLIGQGNWKNGDYHHVADACSADGTNANDCPYICIPKGSFVDGESCDPDGAYTVALKTQYGVGYDKTSGDTRFIGKAPANDDPNQSTGLAEFDNMAKGLSSCRTSGVLYNDAMNNEQARIMWTTTSNGSFTADHGTYRNVKFFDDLRFPACRDVLKVSDGTALKSYAWTDRLLNPISGFVIDNSVTGALRYTRDVVPKPFGLITTDPADLQAPDLPFVAATCETSDGLLVLPSGRAPFDTCSPTSTRHAFAEIVQSNPANPDARSFVSFTLDPDGAMYADEWKVVTAPTAAEGIVQLFAKLNLGVADAVKRWSGTTWTSSGGGSLKYVVPTATTAPANTQTPPTNDLRAGGFPPKVWALNTDNCYGLFCREGQENTLTLNDGNEGDKTGINGFYRGNLKFFAAADKNQLPIRRVIIDWGDGVLAGSDAPDNFYKNHRGLQDDSQTKSKCELATEWGLTPDSCDSNYFTYQHNYTCSAAQAVGPTACIFDPSGRATNAPCSSGGACYFRPAVHVRDNWGWCTGTCTAIGDAGCFEGTVDSLQFPTNANSECSYLTYPADNPSVDPWIRYNGNVIVTP